MTSLLPGKPAMTTPVPAAADKFFGCHLDVDAVMSAELSERQAFAVLSHHAGTHLTGVLRVPQQLEDAASMIGQLLAIIQKQAAGEMLSAEQMRSLTAGIHDYEANLLKDANAVRNASSELVNVRKLIRHYCCPTL